MRALDSGDLAQQRSLVFIDDHDAILSADEQAVIRRIGNDIVPAAIPA